MTPREKQLVTENESLRFEKKVLQDRLGQALSVFAEYEINFELDRMVDEQRNHWFELQQMVLGGGKRWIKKRAERREMLTYKLSMTRIRNWLKACLKAVQERKAA